MADWIGFDNTSQDLPPQPKSRPHMTFDEAIDELESTKVNLAMESKDALELYALQQQVLIGDYYQFDEDTIERYASLLEREQNKAWRRKRGMKTEVASRKFVRLCQEILDFQQVYNDVDELLIPELREDEHIELMSLFQQATVGDNKFWSPKQFPTISDEIWEKWSTKAGLSQRDARDQFAQLARDIADRYDIYIESISHLKPSSQSREFVHHHYHHMQY